MKIRKIICRWVLISQITVTILLAVPVKTAQASQPVFISEIAWAGSSLSSADEWIELFNPADRDVTLGGWRISGAGTSGRDIVFPHETVITAGGVLLIANYAAGDANCALAIDVDVATSTLSLSNTKMLIELRDSAGVLVDRAGNGDAPPAGSSGDVKYSMVRINADLKGDASEAWAMCEESINLLTPDCGTPGEVMIASLVQEDNFEENITPDDADNDQNIIEDNPFIEVVNSEQVDVFTPTGTTTQIFNETAGNTEEELTVSSSTGETAILEVTSSTFATTSTETLIDEMPAVPTSTDMTVAQNLNGNHIKKSILDFLRLNEVMASPITGKEWVEIVNLSLDRNLNLDGLEIYDATGRIATLSGELKPENPYIKVEISSSKLNNSGDSVYLHMADGTLIDTLTYAGHDKGVALARDSKFAWQYTITPTPGAVNAITPLSQISLSDDDNQESGLQTDESTVVSMTVTTALSDESEVSTFYMQRPALNEILPNPTDGKEWVEISCAATSMIIRQEIEIHDAAGKIAVLKPDICISPGIFIQELTSARLNNAGDTVSLRLADGTILDSLQFSGSQKGFSYALMENGLWQETAKPTASRVNFTPKPASQLMTDATTTAATMMTQAKQIVSVVTTSIKKPAAIKKPTTAAKTKTTSAAIKPLIQITEFSMLHNEQFGGSRVILRGTVGTLPRQVSGRSFILLNADGRGLLVSIPSFRKIPDMGSFVEISGTLKFNTYELPYLAVTQNDGWTLREKYSENPETRAVNFLAPAQEDAWSLVAATATVAGISGNTINAIIDDVDVDIKIKPGMAYRASRLTKGDLIAVRGVLDITNDRPTIIPRHADEISILKHQELASAETTTVQSGLPGWAPFGAAAFAVGTLEAAKKFKAHFRKNGKKLKSSVELPSKYEMDCGVKTLADS